MTLQQICAGIARILYQASGCGTPARIKRERETRLARNQLARLFHWKSRSRLAPLNISKRQ
jgi:hypothetical protein